MAKDYFAKTLSKAQQRAKITAENPDFQKEVKTLRKIFNLPVKGLQGNRNSQIWHRKLEQSTETYFETVWRNKSLEIGKLRKLDKFREAELLQKKLNDEAPLNSFRISIKNLLIKYKLPLGWESSVRRYVLFNNIDKMWFQIGITLHTAHDDDTGRMRLYVEITDSTTQKDIRENWEFIEYHKQRLHSFVSKKFQPFKMHDRDKKAYELKKLGKTLKYVAESLSNEFGKQYETYEVSKFIQRYKKKVGII